jgi:protoporphyrinogen oxidase
VSRTVVIGAGLTGLSAAYHLARRGAVAPVLERGSRPGGACSTLSTGPFSFDLSGHLLHLSRRESESLLAEMGVRRRLRRHRRRAGIALGGRITPYPIQINTYRLRPPIRRDCVVGFVRAHLTGEGSHAANFADWVVTRFGEGLARHFFFPYNRKLYRCEPSELTTEWVGRYVPRPRLEDVIDGAFGLYRGSVGYNASFYYPQRGGIQLLADTLAAAVPDLRLDSDVSAIHLAERAVGLANGRALGWDTLVATLPLTQLAAITEDLPSQAREAAQRLRAVAVVSLNLGVRGRAPRREHWLYVPEERFPFYRVGFPSNHGSVAPEGFHTVSVEVSLDAGEPAPAGLASDCIAGLQELGLLGDAAAIEVVREARIDPAYVIFDAARAEAVATLRQALRPYGVVLAGRWAEWKYSTMEDALWDGATVARRLPP